MHGEVGAAGVRYGWSAWFTCIRLMAEMALRTEDVQLRWADCMRLCSVGHAWWLGCTSYTLGSMLHHCRDLCNQLDGNARWMVATG